MLVRRAKLISDVGAHAGFDAARAKRDKNQSGGKPNARVVHRQREVAETINDREKQNSSILAQNRIREKGPDKWQQVHRRNKRVIVTLRLFFRHHIELTLCVHEVSRHEHNEDSLHAVKAEALGGLVANDERHARRHLVRLQRRGEVFGFIHAQAWNPIFRTTKYTKHTKE